MLRIAMSLFVCLAIAPFTQAKVVNDVEIRLADPCHIVLKRKRGKCGYQNQNQNTICTTNANLRIHLCKNNSLSLIVTVVAQILLAIESIITQLFE